MEQGTKNKCKQCSLQKRQSKVLVTDDSELKRNGLGTTLGIFKCSCLQCKEEWFIDIHAKNRRSRRRDLVTLLTERANLFHKTNAGMEFDSTSFQSHQTAYDQDWKPFEQQFEHFCDTKPENHIIAHLSADAAGFENGSSKDFFIKEHKEKGGGMKHVVQNALSKYTTSSEADEERMPKLTREDIDYHLLGATVFHDISKSKQKQVADFINITIDRIKSSQFTQFTPATAHNEIRRVYFENPKSIVQNLPVPKPQKKVKMDLYQFLWNNL